MNHDTVRRCVRIRIESQHAGRNPGLSIQSQDTLVQPGDISGNRSPFHADNREELKFRLAHGQPPWALSQQHISPYFELCDYLPYGHKSLGARIQKLHAADNFPRTRTNHPIELGIRQGLSHGSLEVPFRRALE